MSAGTNTPLELHRTQALAHLRQLLTFVSVEAVGSPSTPETSTSMDSSIWRSRTVEDGQTTDESTAGRIPLFPWR